MNAATSRQPGAGAHSRATVDVLESRRLLSAAIAWMHRPRMPEAGEPRDALSFVAIGFSADPTAASVSRGDERIDVPEFDSTWSGGREMNVAADLGEAHVFFELRSESPVLDLIVARADTLLQSMGWGTQSICIDHDGHAAPMDVEADANAATNHPTHGDETSNPNAGTIAGDHADASTADCVSGTASALVGDAGRGTAATTSDPTLAAPVDLPPAPPPVTVVHLHPARVSADDVHVAGPVSQLPAVPVGVAISLSGKTANEPVVSQTSLSSATTVLLSTAAAAQHTVSPVAAVVSARLIRHIDSSTLFSAAEIAATPAVVASPVASQVAQAVRAARAALSQLPRLAINSLRDATAANAVAGAAPVVGRVVYNLIHLDALGAFSGSTERFISDSLMLGSSHAWSRRRAWFITSAVVAGDLVVVGYLLRTRRNEKAHLARQAVALPRLIRPRHSHFVGPVEREFTAEAR